MEKHLKIADADNVAIALEDLQQGTELTVAGNTLTLKQHIAVKHKFMLDTIQAGDTVTMYGVPVGIALTVIEEGELITVDNLTHKSDAYGFSDSEYQFTAPDVSHLKGKTFNGYKRGDGQVGTANYWIFVPMVFCQNRNLKTLQEAFEAELGYKKENDYRWQIRQLVSGDGEASSITEETLATPVYPNVDGIKFLLHEGGCGGTRDDAMALVRLLAGYIKNPNVAGATVMSLGCQHAQSDLLREALGTEYATDKPVYYFEQQEYSSEHKMLSEVIAATMKGIAQANTLHREPVGLEHLTIGLECGGSDGFSGISANPLIGTVSDKIVALGGKTMLSEFPELCGVEQDLIDRASTKAVAEKFVTLMESYNQKAVAVGSGFDMNPSPGNIKDGLITDAIKSAGAATKGGRSVVADVLDYTEYATKPGLNLLCTPGNDVESTTGLAGSGANIILFSTGLGTPTGNPICPVIKIASNSMLPKKMVDIIDFDAGRLFSEGISLNDLSEELLELIIAVASGEVKTKAVTLGQDDFIPWKRGVSL